ncbi:MAG: Hpt domain-containing protein [Lachnospiraceae bacterium]|nr:Hpt domain-containing protein [Lachnospiraceae bacterium]
MTLQECYAALGGDYEDASSRLHSERLVQKFVLKFLDDKSYDLFCSSMAEKNYEEAFRAAHTIKGMCQNLSFTRLQKSSSQMSDALRHGWTPEADALIDLLKSDYQNTVAAIREYQKECGGQ